MRPRLFNSFSGHTHTGNKKQLRQAGADSIVISKLLNACFVASAFPPESSSSVNRPRSFLHKEMPKVSEYVELLTEVEREKRQRNRCVTDLETQTSQM